MKYKAPDNSLHFLDDGVDPASVKGFPQNAVPITDEEANEITLLNQPKADFVEEAKTYLISTDWYVTRFLETGKPIPEEVSTKRSEARKLI